MTTGSFNKRLDPMDDDIPVVDASGKKSVLKGFGPVGVPAKSGAAASPTPSQSASAPVSAADAAAPEAPAKPSMAPSIAELLSPAAMKEAPAFFGEEPAPAAKVAPAAAPAVAVTAAPAQAEKQFVPANLPVVDDIPAYAKKSPALAAALAPFAASAVVVPPPPTPAPVPAAEQLPVATGVSRGDLGLDTERDTSDIQKIEAQPVVQELEAEQKKEMTLLDRTVEDATIATGGALRDDDTRRRFRMLISLFFRGLRDGLETKSKFTMPAASGGMGLKEEEAERLMADLSARSKQYQEQLRGEAAENKSQYVAARTEKVLNLQEKTDLQEKEKGDRAFKGLLDRVGMRSDELMPPKPPAPPQAIPVVAADTASAMRPAGNAVAVALKEPAPAPAPVFRPANAPRPVVADVSYAPKLVGPVEEMRTLTLKDFRRLSREPREAALKIKDKIDLLEEQSFTLKTQGIDAWHDSEINRLYLDILRQSLEGKPVGDVIAEREKNGMPVITQAEFDAVMDLNRKLRFG